MATPNYKVIALANVRAKPAVDAEVQRIAQPGEQLDVGRIVDLWAELADGDGYVHISALQPIPNAKPIGDDQADDSEEVVGDESDDQPDE